MFPVFLVRIDGSRLCRNHLLEARMIFVEPYAPNSLAHDKQSLFLPRTQAKWIFFASALCVRMTQRACLGEEGTQFVYTYAFKYLCLAPEETRSVG